MLQGKTTAKKKVKKKAKTAVASQESPPVKTGPSFSHTEVFSKPKDLSTLFAGFKEDEVEAKVIRPRLLTEAVELGRGRGAVRHFSFRKFKGEPRAVLFVTMPRPLGGGSFEPTDRMLKPGEPIQITYTMGVEGASHPIFFLAKGYFLRKSFYVAEDPKTPGKPWIGPRDEALQTLSKDLVVGGEEVVELRIDNVTSFPNGPGHLGREVLDRYLSEPRLLVIPGGGAWNQKSTQGHFFDSIRDPLDQYISRDNVKCIEQIKLDDFANLGEVALICRERLLEGVDHEVARPRVVRKPNDFLAEINSKLGFLLRFRVDPDIAEALGRSFPSKAGKEDEIYLPMLLEKVKEGREQFRLDFRLFPRDLVEERGRRATQRGLKFMPPYALHPGAENHNTYSKLLIILSKRHREDEKPDEEKIKSEKLKASVEKRIAERKHAFTDEKVKAAFKDRVAAKKRQED